MMKLKRKISFPEVWFGAGRNCVDSCCDCYRDRLGEWDELERDRKAGGPYDTGLREDASKDAAQGEPWINYEHPGVSELLREVQEEAAIRWGDDV